MIATVVRWLSPDRLRAYPRLLPIFFLPAWLYSQWAGPGLLDLTKTVVGSDFLAFYSGAREVLAGQWEHLYDVRHQQVVQRAVVAPFPYEAVHPFVNPPAALLLFVPFALGGYLPGLVAWMTCGAALLLACAAALTRALPGLRGRSPGRLALLALCFYPTLAWWTYGQNAPMSLAVYVGGWLLLRRGADAPAGAVLGLLAYKPQLALGWVVLLLAARRWRALLAMGATGVGITALAFALHPDATWAYLEVSPSLPGMLRRHVPVLPELPPYPTWGIASALGFASLLLDAVSRPAASALLGTLLLAGAVALGSLWWGRSWEPGTRSWDLRSAASVTLIALISPHLFIYDLLLLLLPLAILLHLYPEGRAGRALDGGPILFWTAAVWGVSFMGPYLAKAQLYLCALAGLPAVAVQLTLPVLAAWAYTLAREADAGSASAREATPQAA